jgi:L-asparagine transporter-like permease
MMRKQHLFTRESGLSRDLGSGQMSMIAIGGAIGTGLFLGIGWAISLAGPAVLLSYAIGAVLGLLVSGCLAEMTIAHPISGSFGAYAEYYVGPLAGFLVRYVYWIGNVLAVGTEVAAIALYMRFWFPDSPGWFWSAGLSLALIYVNSTKVTTFGAIEYALSTAKLAALALFLLLTGSYLFAPTLVGGSAHGSITFHNYVAYGGFFARGLWGSWVAVILAVFSYMGMEMVSVAAGEAQAPEVAVRRAFRSTAIRLILFYLVTLTAILAILPWTAARPTTSPFVQVMELLHLPHAAGIVNFVVLLAALSAMNGQLYIATRMMFSLSRASLAPVAFGQVNSRGVPTNALLISAAGVALAVVLDIVIPDSAYVSIVAISIFSAAFSWLMIFVTHYFFRHQRVVEGQHATAQFRMIGFPVSTLAGATLMAAVLLTTLFIREFRLTLLVGIPFLAILTVVYYLRYCRR